VNAGAAEVAKIFLSPSRVHSDMMQAQLRVEAARDISHELERRNAIMEANTDLDTTRARVIKLKVHHLHQ
jgi:hypothetical protein